MGERPGRRRTMWTSCGPADEIGSRDGDGSVLAERRGSQPRGSSGLRRRHWRIPRHSGSQLPGRPGAQGHHRRGHRRPAVPAPSRVRRNRSQRRTDCPREPGQRGASLLRRRGHLPPGGRAGGARAGRVLQRLLSMEASRRHPLGGRLQPLGVRGLRALRGVAPAGPTPSDPGERTGRRRRVVRRPSPPRPPRQDEPVAGLHGHRLPPRAPVCSRRQPRGYASRDSLWPMGTGERGPGSSRPRRSRHGAVDTSWATGARRSCASSSRTPRPGSSGSSVGPEWIRPSRTLGPDYVLGLQEGEFGVEQVALYDVTLPSESDWDRRTTRVEGVLQPPAVPLSRPIASRSILI